MSQQRNQHHPLSFVEVLPQEHESRVAPVPPPRQQDRQRSSPLHPLQQQPKSQSKPKVQQPQMKHQQQQAPQKQKDTKISLPRTIQWRIQLGLLAVPSSATRNNNAPQSNNTPPNNNNRQHDNANPDPFTAPITQGTILKQIQSTNARLITAQRERYDALFRKHMTPGSRGTNSREAPSSRNYSDPLSMMVEEQENFEEEQKKCPIFSIIRKDLDRIPPHHHRFNAQPNGATRPVIESKANDTLRREERFKVLSQILLIYAKEYPELSYRQGMHEVLSYVIMALELDLQKHSNSFQPNLIWDQNHLSHDGYTLFEIIMYHLSPAYDCPFISKPPLTAKEPAQRPSAKRCLVSSIGDSVLLKIKNTQSNDALYHHLKNDLNIPPQMYITRWIRLMLAREISSTKGVFILWDAFFQFLKFGKSTLLDVLEYTAAANILIMRENKLTSLDDSNETLHALMNCPPMEDVKVLLEKVRVIMWFERGAGQQQRRSVNASSAATSKHNVYSGSMIHPLAAPHSISSGGAPNNKNLQRMLPFNALTQKLNDLATHTTQALSDVSHNISENIHIAKKARDYSKIDAKLTSSVNVLADYFKSLQEEKLVTVPKEVWEAVGEVENVRKSLGVMDNVDYGKRGD